MAPRKKNTAPVVRPRPEPYIKEGPPPGTLARRLWLEQQAIELADAIKEEVKRADLSQAVMAVCLLSVVIGDLADERRDTSAR